MGNCKSSAETSNRNAQLRSRLMTVDSGQKFKKIIKKKKFAQLRSKLMTVDSGQKLKKLSKHIYIYSLML